MRALKKEKLPKKEIKVKFKNPHRISLRRMQIIESRGEIKVFTEKGFTMPPCAKSQTHRE